MIGYPCLQAGEDVISVLRVLEKKNLFLSRKMAYITGKAINEPFSRKLNQYTFAKLAGVNLGYFAEGAGVEGLKAMKEGMGATKYNEWVNYIKEITGEDVARLFKI